MDRETLRNLPREEQNKFIKQYLLGGRWSKDLSKEPVYLDHDDGTFTELNTGRIFQASELDLNGAIVFE